MLLVRDSKLSKQLGKLLMDLYIQAFITIISLINPVICAAIFEKLQSQESGDGKNQAAIKAMLGFHYPRHVGSFWNHGSQRFRYLTGRL